MEILDQIFENPQNIQRNLQSCGFFKKIIRISVATAIPKSIHHHGQQDPAAPQPPQPTAQMAPRPPRLCCPTANTAPQLIKPTGPTADMAPWPTRLHGRHGPTAYMAPWPTYIE